MDKVAFAFTFLFCIVLCLADKTHLKCLPYSDEAMPDVKEETTIYFGSKVVGCPKKWTWFERSQSCFKLIDREGDYFESALYCNQAAINVCNNIVFPHLAALNTNGIDIILEEMLKMENLTSSKNMSIAVGYLHLNDTWQWDNGKMDVGPRKKGYVHYGDYILRYKKGCQAFIADIKPYTKNMVRKSCYEKFKMGLCQIPEVVQYRSRTYERNQTLDGMEVTTKHVLTPKEELKKCAQMVETLNESLCFLILCCIYTMIFILMCMAKK